MESSSENSGGERGRAVTTALVVLGLSALYLAALCSIDINGTYVGFGHVVFRHIISFGERKPPNSPFSYGIISVGVAVLAFIVVYLSDALRHVRTAGMFSTLFASIVLAISISLAVAACFLMTYKFLFAPYLGFIAVSILLGAVLKFSLLKNFPNRIYYRSIIVSLILSFCGTLSIWIVSLSQGQVWDFRTQVQYHQRLLCDQGTKSFDELLSIADSNAADRKLLPKCDEALQVYLSPFVFLCGSAIFIGLFIYLFRSEKRRQESGEAKMDPAARIFFGLLIMSIFALWVGASISSVTKDLAGNVLWISAIVLIALFGVWLSTFGVQYFIRQLKATSIGTKGIEFLANDWGKSLILFTSLPFIVLGRGVYVLKRFIHRKSPRTDVAPVFVDTELQNKHKLENWEYGSILPKALVWGMVYFLISVGVPRVIVVFLSALRGWVAGIHLLGISGILLGVGLLLFLLPPVPGFPVYALCGVVIPNLESSVLGFWGGIVYAVMLSFLLKLLAIVMQQKLIGELWGSKSVWVRQFIQINSVEIRATRKILSRPGLKFSKVIILCAGPDWPTSVLTGIMRLNVFQMLLGSLPVILLIVPVVLSGAMVVRASENEIYSSVSKIIIALTVVLEAVSLLWAAKVIADVAVKYEEELKNADPDRKVLEREGASEYREREYRYLTAWRNLGSIWKIGHVLSIILMVSSSYAFVFVGGRLFEAFEIQDDFSGKLNGNVLNLIKTPGWVALALFTTSTTYYIMFSLVFGKKKAPEGAVEPMGSNNTTETHSNI